MLGRLLALSICAMALARASVKSSELFGMSALRGEYTFDDKPLWSFDEDVGARLSCTHRRADVLVAALRYLDTNDDACVDLDEMRFAFERCLTWYERLGMRLGHIFGVVQTPESTMDDCDRNDDRRMCVEDVLATNAECAADAAPVAQRCMCTCQPIDQMFSYVFDREPCFE